MSCEPERVTALVDGALPAGEAAALRAHLEACPGCRAQAEGERLLHERLRELTPLEMPAGLETRLRARLARRPPYVRPLAAALPVAAALAVVFWARGFAPFVAWELARDHDHCLSRAVPPAVVRSAQPAAVAAWFARRGTPTGALPERLANAQLFGARDCYLPDVSSVAHLFYLSADRRLSLFVMRHGVRMGDVYRGGARGRSVALLRVRDRVVGIVGARVEDVDAAVDELRSATAVRVARRVASRPRVPGEPRRLPLPAAN